MPKGNTNISVSPAVHEALKIIKKRNECVSFDHAIDRLLIDHEADVLKSAIEIVALEKEIEKIRGGE